MISTVILRLILIRHGDSSQAGLSTAASTDAWDKRHLLPAGVRQVSASARALLQFVRTSAVWFPGLILTAKGKQCSETAEAVCQALSEYDAAGEWASWGDADAVAPPPPSPLYVEELDAPRPIQIA
eukprot:2816115-Amphidinium_carterae.1